MVPVVKVPENRPTEREGVNFARTLFERESCMFQEVPRENDFGKDAYVDVNRDDGVVTGVCAALQIKSGITYRRGDDYAIPIGKHRSAWAGSTVPLMGLVFDPERTLLCWCSITDFMHSARAAESASIPVYRRNVLDRQSLKSDFLTAILRAAGLIGLSPISRVLTSSKRKQQVALYECFALGRHDPGALIALRYVLRTLRGESLQLAINLLSHVTPHPDILWTKHNWLPESVKSAVRAHLTWSPDEVALLMGGVPFELWERGEPGQSLFMLLSMDNDFVAKLEKAVSICMDAGDAETAVSIAVVLAALDPPGAFARTLDAYPALRSESLVGEVLLTIRDHGHVSLF